MYLIPEESLFLSIPCERNQGGYSLASKSPFRNSMNAAVSQS